MLGDSIKKETEYLNQLFDDYSDCYADAGQFENDGSYIEGEVVPAMTKEMFVQLVINQVLKGKLKVIKKELKKEKEQNAKCYREET